QVARPPIPEPMRTPISKRVSSLIGRRASSTAMMAAATPTWQKRSIRFASFRSMYRCGSKPGSSPAIRVEYSEQSKAVTAPSPEGPATIPAHVSSVVRPRGLTIPRPVTTTLLSVMFALAKSVRPLRLRLLFDIVDGVRDGRDLFRVLVGDFDLELFLERHDQLQLRQPARA